MAISPVAIVVGRLISDPVFRDAFEANPDATLSAAGLNVSAADVTKLKGIAGKLRTGLATHATRAVGGGGQGGANLHCQVASSVGYA